MRYLMTVTAIEIAGFAAAFSDMPAPFAGDRLVAFGSIAHFIAASACLAIAIADYARAARA